MRHRALCEYGAIKLLYFIVIFVRELDILSVDINMVDHLITQYDYTVCTTGTVSGIIEMNQPD